MARYTDLFRTLTDDQVSKTLDLTKGGMEGVMPKIGDIVNDKTYETHIANALHVSQDVIAKVLTVPRFFNWMPNPDAWRKSWVAIFEEHAKDITGFNRTITVEVEDIEIGGSGEFLSAIKDVKRARTKVTLEIPEKLGKTVSNFIELCIFYGMKDPIVKRPLASSFIGSLDEIGGGWTPDMYSGSVLYIEPDVTRLSALDAYLQVQVFFMGTGDIISKKSLASGGDTTTLSVETAGITVVGNNVKKFANVILPTIENIQAIPDIDMVLPVDGVDPELKTEE